MRAWPRGCRHWSATPDTPVRIRSSAQGVELDMLYGYVDYTLESLPRPYYVGIGSLTRVKNQKRNHRHCHVTKHLGRCRIVEFESLSEEALKAWEIETIARYHTYIHDQDYNGVGCNLTKGGQRNAGRVDSPEIRRKRGLAISVAKKGKSYPQPKTKGRKRPPRSEAWKQNLSKALANKKRKGTPKADSTKEKMRIAAMGNTNGRGNKGVTRHCGKCDETDHDSRNCLQVEQ